MASLRWKVENYDTSMLVFVLRLLLRAYYYDVCNIIVDCSLIVALYL